MLWEWVALMGLVGLVGIEPDRVAIPTEFETWFDAAKRGPLPTTPEVARKAAGYRYLFVGGYRNERMPGYFAQNLAELRAMGVPRGSIHVIQPSSGRTSAENARQICERVRSIAEQGPEKLVVIAHSRGACDALGFAITNPEFVRDRVEALFLIQGPFGGSGVAEYVLGRGTPMDRRMPLRHRILGHLAGRVARSMARRGGRDVLEEMTTESSRAYWSRMLAEHADALPVVGPRTFYVRSTIEPSKLRFVRRAIAWYLATYHGPSDGMVALADQRLPGVGTVVADLDAAHGDLTHRFPATRASRSSRKALIRTIFRTVGRAPDLASDQAPETPRENPKASTTVR